MFNIFKKSPPLLPNYSSLKVDLHSHLLPGIDDGAKTIEDSIQLIKQLKDLGFQELITTPHIMADLYPNTPEIIKAKLEEVRKALDEEGIDIKISAAAEYLMDEAFGNKVEARDLLTLPGNRVLVEMSFISPPPNLETYLFLLQTKGYRPILAHPERYLFYRGQFDKYQELKERGCEFQVNLLSLAGYYGKPTKENANRLLKEGLVDYLATDIHHEKHAYLLREVLSKKSFNKMLSQHTNQLKNKQLKTVIA